MPPSKPAGAAGRRAGPEAPHPLATPLQFVKGIGPQRAKLLANLGLHTVEDALYYLPTRHEDRSQLTPLRSLKPNDVTTVPGTIRAISPPPRGRPRVPLSVLLSDGTGFLTCVWFGQAYLERQFQRGQRLIVHGKAQRYRSGPLQMQVKDFEIVEDEAGDGAAEPGDETLHTGRLVPVYGLTRGLTARPMRRMMKRLVDGYVDGLDDPLPDALRARHRLELLEPGPARRPLPQDGRGLRVGAPAARLRRVPAAAARPRDPPPPPGTAARPRHEPARGAGPAPARGAAVRAHARAGAGVARDPDGHGRALPDEPAPAGRRGLGQDGGGRARDPHRGRGRATRPRSWRRPRSWPSSTS